MIKRIRVTLTFAEVFDGAVRGIRRYIQNIHEGMPDNYGADPEQGWAYHINGCLGEMVVAKWRDKFYTGNIGNRKADDVSTYQVRTGSKHHYKLLIYKKDANEKQFILVTGLPPHYDIVGWAWGHEGKKEEYWTDPTGDDRPNYFVPQEVLHDMDEL